MQMQEHDDDSNDETAFDYPNGIGTPRLNREVALPELMARTLGAHAPADIASWTEEQWAAHDADIASKRRAASEREFLARRADVVAEMIARDGWPRRAIEVALEADISKAAIAKLGELDLKKRNVAVISGAAGCGKTVGCAWWALQQRNAVKFVRASTFAAASRYDREERNVWLRAPALVLDDAGAEYSDAKGSLTVDLDELIDTFYGDRRPLLITTNATIAEFKKRYGNRITDRLRECGRWVEIPGDSLRTKS